MIDRLRKILHNNEFTTEINEGGYKRYKKTKLSYKITKQDIEYVKYFSKHFNQLSDKDKDRVLDKEKSGNYKIYVLSGKNGMEYIGSTSTSLFFFYRFNMYLKINNQQSVFDHINGSVEGSKITLLEIVNPQGNNRELVNERKRVYQDKMTNSGKVDPIKIDTGAIDAYMSIYRTMMCGSFGKKEPRYIYRAHTNNNSYIFMTKKLINNNKIKHRLEDIFKKKEIDIDLIEKTFIRNELEENILADRYRIIYKPTLNKKFKLKELEEFSSPVTDEKIKEFKRIIFLRINKMRFMSRVSDKTTNYVYMLRNKVNGNGIIKYEKEDPKTLIGKIYDRAIKRSNGSLPKDVTIYEEKEFEFKILRVLKEDDDPDVVVRRFQNRFRLSGYSINIRQIYAIINAKKGL